MKIFSLQERAVVYSKLIEEDPLFFALEQALDRAEQNLKHIRNWEKATHIVEEWLVARKYVAQLFQSKFPDRMVKMSYDSFREKINLAISMIEREYGYSIENRFTLANFLMCAQLITYYMYKKTNDFIFCRIFDNIRNILNDFWFHNWFDNILIDLKHVIDDALENGDIPDTYDYTREDGKYPTASADETKADENNEDEDEAAQGANQETVSASLTAPDLKARDIIAIFLAYDLLGRNEITQKELNAMAAQLVNGSPSTFHKHWSEFANGDSSSYDQALRKAQRRREKLLDQ